MSYLEERRKFIADGRPLPEKKKHSIPKKSQKRIEKEKEQRESKGDSGLDAYFAYHMEHSYPRCENCGMEALWLKEEGNEFFWRGCHAHVLAKKDSIGGFPSIAANLTNHLVLFPHFRGLCGCHNLYDSSYEAMAKMAVFPKAIDIINQLYPFIKPEERKYLPEIICQEIKPEIYNSKI